MNTNRLITETVKFLSGTSFGYSTYIGFGTSGTAASRSDTILYNQVGTSSVNITREGQVGKISTLILSTDTSLSGHNINETGILTTSGTGLLLNRETLNNSFSTGTTKEVEIIKFIAVGTDNLTGVSFVTDSMLGATVNSFGGTNSPPTYTAYGTARIIERCESGTTSWSKSTAAAFPELNTTNYQSGTGAINLGKTGTSTGSFYYIKEVSPTVDLSSAETFRVWLDVLTIADLNKLKSSDCLQIRFGSGTVTDYKYYNLDRTDMINGWKEYSIAISDFSGTGTPNLAATKYIGLFWETTNATDTITSGNIIMDYWNAIIPIYASDNSMNDEITRTSNTNLRSSNSVEFRDTLSATQGNTYNYEYFSLFNASGSGQMYYIIKSPRVVKTSSNQINPYIRLVVSEE